MPCMMNSVDRRGYCCHAGGGEDPDRDGPGGAGGRAGTPSTLTFLSTQLTFLSTTYRVLYTTPGLSGKRRIYAVYIYVCRIYAV